MKNQELLTLAEEMLSRAYVPYSKFSVGAALLCQNGKVYTGCNIENATYGATICAERAAIAQAICAGEKEFVKIAVVSSEKGICTPCGICRQVLVEFAPDMEVICSAENGEIRTYAARDLLPDRFVM